MENLEIIEKAKANVVIDEESNGKHFLLPYNRAYSLFKRPFKVFYTDFVARPAYYVRMDARLASKAGLTSEEAQDLKKTRLRDIESYYAKQTLKKNEIITSKAKPARSDKSDNDGKGGKDKAA